MKDTIQELRYEKDEIMKLMSKSQAKKIAELQACVVKQTTQIVDICTKVYARYALNTIEKVDMNSNKSINITILFINLDIINTNK